MNYYMYLTFIYKPPLFQAYYIKLHHVYHKDFDIRFKNKRNCKIQKQPPEVFCKKSCSYKFHKIHRKTPVPQACNFIKKETLAQVFSC